MSDRYHVLLELEYASETHRLSDVAVSVVSAITGATYDYSASFDDLTISQALAFLAVEGTPSVAVQCVLGVDVAALYAAGQDLSRSPVEISLWKEGDSYEERLLLMRGIVTNPTWRFYGDPVSFSVELPENVYDIEYPPATQAVTGDTVGQSTVLTLALEDINVVYPTVFGSPGKTGNTTWVAATQGVWAIHQGQGTAGPLNYLRLILAGHHVTGTFVTLCGDDDLNPNGHRFKVQNTYDLLGQPVAVCWEGVDFIPGDSMDVNLLDGTGNNLSAVDLNPENIWYYGLGAQGQPNAADLNPNLTTTLYQPSTVVPAAATPSNPVTVPITSALFAAWREYTSTAYVGDGIVGLSPAAGDIIVYMLLKAGLTVDYARMKSVANLLNVYRFDCCIDARVRPLEWLESNILPYLPVSLAQGVNGWYAVYWNKSATARDAVADLNCDYDAQIRLVGDVAFDSEIANSMSLQYQYDMRGSRYTKTIYRGGSPNLMPAQSTTVITGSSTYVANPDSYSLISQQTFGVHTREYTTACVYDDATASRILSDKMMAFAFPRMRLVYTVPRSYKLELGQVAKLTDPNLSLTDAVVLVTKLEIDTTGLDAAQLLLIKDPVRGL